MEPKIRDKFLIHKVAKGDSDAFGKIYENYITKIYRFIFFKVSSKEIAEDLASQVFYKLLTTIKNPEVKIENLQAFLYQIARNLVIDYYRQNNKTVDLEDDIIDTEISSQEKIIEKIDLKADIEKVRQALDGMKEEYRDLIIWYYLEGLQAQEIAGFLNKTPGAVRVLIHRALNQLKTKLEA
ncbi:MAG: RNA polymerase sigma factor [Patescibacteria group bacterium]